MLAASVLVVGPLVVACLPRREVTQVGPSEPPHEPWAHEAAAWVERLPEVVLEQGALGALPFVAEGVVTDLRNASHVGAYSEGPASVADWYLTGPEDHVRSRIDPVVYLDRSGSVLTGSRDAVPLLGETLPLLAPFAVRLDVGADGIERYTVLRGETLRDDDPAPRSAAIHAAAREIATTWTELWSRDGVAADDVYSAGAVLVDTIGRIDVRGTTAIADRIEVAPTTRWTVAEHAHGPAVYPLVRPAWFSSDAELVGLAAIVEGDDGTGCPGAEVVWLDIEPTHGGVLAERRFRSLTDARRCIAADDLPPGWWTGRPLPGPAAAPILEDLDTVTHRIANGAGTTAIRNATPTLAMLVQWGISRFDLGGLRLPGVDGVVFTAYADYCDGVAGRAVHLDDAGGAGVSDGGHWDVLLCFDEDAACLGEGCEGFTRRARYVVVHELAHVWLAENVHAGIRERFLERLGLTAWSDPQLPWDEQGVEWAASFVGWGLLDEHYGLWELGNPPVEQRYEGYQLLTGRQPLRPTAATG